MKRKTTHKKAARAGLTLNSTADAAVFAIVNLPTVNRKMVSVKTATLNGKEYKVVPMVMITEGVHAGSNGPLFYPKEELSKFVANWNHKPVTIKHPERAGEAASACDADMLEQFSVGMIMNSKWDKVGKRITAEAWIDTERLKVVDGGDKVESAMTSNKMLELSTGVFTENTEESGEYEGAAYETVARNYRADHLAILPDQVGACSKAKGAGFIRNAAKVGDTELTPAQRDMAEAAGISIVANALSYGQISEQAYSLLCEKFPRDESKNIYCPWVSEVFPATIIYNYDGKLYAQKYVKSDADKITFDGEPVEVVRTTQYKALSDGSLVVNANANIKHQNTMKKEDIIASLVANHGYTEAEKATLNAKSEEVLKDIHDAAERAKKNAPAAPVANAEHTKEIAALKATLETLTANAAAEAKKEKDAVIAGIVANKANKRSAEDLAKFDITALRAISEAFGTAKPVANYSGQGGNAPEGSEAPTANADVLEDGAPVWTK